MRVIKFRGKRLYDGEWVYGYPLIVDTEKYKSANIVTMHEAYPDTLAKVTTSVEFNTLGQFTGLHDKNGKEIYEGDVIKWYEIGHSDHDVLEPPEDYIKECMEVVAFVGGTFCVNREEEAPSPIPVAYLTEDFQANEDDMFKWVYNTDEYPNITIDDMYICEVIGNIHDNPELIEKGGEQ